MPDQRVMAIGLDGVEVTFLDRLIEGGEMPALAALRQRAARFLLDHGAAQRTGLAWEHVASGLSPERGHRWAAVEFDPRTYRVWQEGARFEPWWANVNRRVVVFDAPYVDLRRAPKTRGVVAWGAHDPGTALAARPRSLLREFLQRHGAYPARWTYGTPWPSPARTQEMGTVLAQALDARARAARWLATERLPEWDLFFAVAGEVHGTIEGLWHGIDVEHPLHEHASARPAADGMMKVHHALDRMVGELLRCAGDAALVVFTMGGMGPNHSDTQSMVLLPELLFRHAFGRPLLAVPPTWAAVPADVPVLDPDDDWGTANALWVPTIAPASSRAACRRFVDASPMLKTMLLAVRTAVRNWRLTHGAKTPRDLGWQPAARYGKYWPRMESFALPSFYDGRIRINLKGRERDGIVRAADYADVCRRVEALLRECRNPLTGEPAVDAIERPATRNPLHLGTSESDLLVVWRGIATALEHPRLGLIGPVALRRTGGHTGRHGFAYVVAPTLEPGDHGVRSSFDIAPTLVELLGCRPMATMSGSSLLHPSIASVGRV
jgi:predicted AlkP superfamily phosphohydrolase/phosphomutase